MYSEAISGHHDRYAYYCIQRRFSNYFFADTLADTGLSEVQFITRWRTDGQTTTDGVPAGSSTIPLVLANSIQRTTATDNWRFQLINKYGRKFFITCTLNTQTLALIAYNKHNMLQTPTLLIEKKSNDLTSETPENKTSLYAHIQSDLTMKLQLVSFIPRPAYRAGCTGRYVIGNKIFMAVAPKFPFHCIVQG